MSELAGIARELQTRRGLDEVLECVVGALARILRVERTSVRLLDPTRTKLLAICRAGSPLHENPATDFELGEGLLGWIALTGKPLRSGAAERDPRFVARPGMKTALGSFLGVPLLAGERCIGVLSAVEKREHAFDEADEDTAVLLAAIAAPHVEIARLARLSRVDGLTGVLNRRGLEESTSEDEALTVAMVDVDHFKRINDEHGHGTGDLVLKELAERLRGVLRNEDAVVRYGGEEFLLLLRRVRLATGAAIAERARQAVERPDIKVPGASLAVTVSIGVARRKPGESRDALVARADAAMYAAKRAGRNRVALADD
jgi:diguanylate cyclase (GGDEF)-like protein